MQIPDIRCCSSKDCWRDGAWAQLQQQNCSALHHGRRHLHSADICWSSECLISEEVNITDPICSTSGQAPDQWLSKGHCGTAYSWSYVNIPRGWLTCQHTPQFAVQKHLWIATVKLGYGLEPAHQGESCMLSPWQFDDVQNITADNVILNLPSRPLHRLLQASGLPKNEANQALLESYQIRATKLYLYYPNAWYGTLLHPIEHCSECTKAIVEPYQLRSAKEMSRDLHWTYSYSSISALARALMEQFSIALSSLLCHPDTITISWPTSQVMYKKAYECLFLFLSKHLLGNQKTQSWSQKLSDMNPRWSFLAHQIIQTCSRYGNSIGKLLSGKLFGNCDNQASMLSCAGMPNTLGHWERFSIAVVRGMSNTLDYWVLTCMQVCTYQCWGNE